MRKLPHLLAFLSASLCHGQTLIDVEFPDGTGINAVFTEIDNGVGTTNTWTQATGVFTTSTNNNSTVGAASEATVDLGALDADRLVLQVSLSEADFGNLSGNGMFIGIQDSNDPTGAGLWNNHNPSFGFWLPGGAGGFTQREVSVGGNAGAGRYQEVGYAVATVASILDGFDVTLTLDSEGWQVVVDGLLDAGGAAITGGSATWAESVQDITNFTADMHVGISYQTPINDAGTVTLSRIALTQEPAGQDSDFRIESFSYDDDPVDPFTTITWKSEPDQSYALDYSTSLAEGQWIEVVDDIPSGGETTSTEHHFLPSFPELLDVFRLFYRIRLVPSD